MCDIVFSCRIDQRNIGYDVSFIGQCHQNQSNSLIFKKHARLIEYNISNVTFIMFEYDIEISFYMTNN